MGELITHAASQRHLADDLRVDRLADPAGHPGLVTNPDPVFKV